MNTDRLTRYAPTLVFIGVMTILMLFGAVSYWRKGGQLTTADPGIIIVATSTPPAEPHGAIGYFDYLNPSTAVAFNPSDIEGPIAKAEGCWRLVLLRGGGQVWFNECHTGLVDLSPRRSPSDPVQVIIAPAPTAAPEVVAAPAPVQITSAPAPEPTSTPWVVGVEVIGEVVDWDGNVTRFTVR